MHHEASTVRNVLAFDIGGSHISGALCELNSLQVVRVARKPLPMEAHCNEFLGVLDELSRLVSPNRASIAGAALAMPGPFDFTVGVSYMQHKLKSLYGINLRSALAQRFTLPKSKLSFVNDAAAFLLGEIHSGAARGAKRAVGVVVGTGIGCAFAEDGKWVTNGIGIPPGGEIWNLPYRDGIVEDLLSTKAIKSNYAARTDQSVDVRSIALRAGSDPHARTAFERFGIDLGQVFRDILAPFDPEVIVIGGGISRSSQLFLPFAKNQLNGVGLKLITSTLLDQAALIGAAAFWLDGNDTVDR